MKNAAIGQNTPRASLDLSPIPEIKNNVIGYTDIGVGRKKNQDAAGVCFTPGREQDEIILALGDGLGSYEYSERASFDAVTTIPLQVSEGLEISAACSSFHRELIRFYPYIPKQQVNNHKAQYKNRLKGVSAQEDSSGELLISGDRGATTLVLARIRGQRAEIANVGDSRAYLFRNNKIVYKTRDQSMVALLRDEGEKMGETGSLERHPLAALVLNALGSPEPVFRFVEKGETVIKESGRPIIDEVELEENDYLFLVSDGVFFKSNG